MKKDNQEKSHNKVKRVPRTGSVDGRGWRGEPNLSKRVIVRKRRPVIQKSKKYREALKISASEPYRRTDTAKTVMITYEGKTWKLEQVNNPDQIDTPMKIDWKLDREKYMLSYRTAGEQPKLVKMHPKIFLDIQPINPDYIDKSSLKSIRKGLKEGSVFNTPRLILNPKGEVVEHEGRHRAMVLDEMGATEMPVAIITDYGRR